MRNSAGVVGLWLVGMAAFGCRSRDDSRGATDAHSGGVDSNPLDSSATDSTDSGKTDTGKKDSAETDSGITQGIEGLTFDGKRPKNLLVLSLDTARRDTVGFFDELGLTPNLVSFFSGGVILEDHRSCSIWTLPSVYCAQSGRFGLDEGNWPTEIWPGERDKNVPWPLADGETIASLLTGAGFYTELITTNSLFSSEASGPAHGFSVEQQDFMATADAAVDRALATAGTNLQGTVVPWYLHVHFMDPHDPYQAGHSYLPDPDLECKWDLTSGSGLAQFIWVDYWAAKDQDHARACILNVYQAEFRAFDAELARLTSGLEAMGLLDDTLVVFWTDHGEAFAEHGYFQHQWTLYDEENRAAAAFWAKNIQPMQWAGPTLHQDLTPTILDALGLPLGSHTGFVLGTAPPERTRITFEYHLGRSPMIAAIQGDAKLMYWWAGTQRFYDLGLDPGEQNDLYDPKDPSVQALWDVLGPIVTKTEVDWGLKAVDPGP